MLPVLIDTDFYLKKDAVVNQSFRLNICTEEFKKLTYMILAINDIELTDDSDDRDEKTEQYSDFIEALLNIQCTKNLSTKVSSTVPTDTRNLILDTLSEISNNHVKYAKESDWNTITKVVYSLMMNTWDGSVSPSPFNQILTGINSSTLIEVNKYN